MKNEIDTESKCYSKVPWASLLTSAPVWALIVAQLGHDWGLFFLGSYIPKFLKKTLRLSFQEAGRYGALAYFVACIVSFGSGALGDYIIDHGILTRTQSRKLFTLICNEL